MADNLGFTQGSGVLLRTLDIGGVHHPATVILDSAGNAIASSATALAGTERGVVTRNIPARHHLATYAAVFRLAARPYALSKAHTANSRFHYATIHHAASAVKSVRIRRILFALKANSVAGVLTVDLERITTAPATGNPAVTPVRHDVGDAAAEATCLALPTTQGTTAGTLATVEYNVGVTGAVPTTNPPAPLTWLELYSEDEASVVGDAKPLILRPGQLEGIAVTGDHSAASTVTSLVVIRFTEE